MATNYQYIPRTNDPEPEQLRFAEVITTYEAKPEQGHWDYSFYGLPVYIPSEGEFQAALEDVDHTAIPLTSSSPLHAKGSFDPDNCEICWLVTK